MNLALAVTLVGVGLTGASAQSLKGESGLIGIKLYDSGLRVISVYGSPDDIQAVSFGGGNVGPTGGGGGLGGGPAGVAPAGGGSTGAADTNFDFSFGNEVLRQGAAGPGGFDVGPPPGAGGSSGPPGFGGDSGTGRGGPGGPGGAAPGGGGAAPGNSGKVVFTRWVYKRAGSRYAFVMDKTNRVIQIEAVGMSNTKVRTSSGLTFGASFGAIIKKHGAPDGYELYGDHLMVRYLVRNKVAFRLSRLGMDKPHVITGIVVAAGKT